MPGMESVLGVLVVADDDPMIRRVMVKVFGRAGWAVREADSHHAVPATVGGDGGSIADVLLLDLTMDGPPPAEYVPGLLAGHPRLKVVLASGYSEDDQITALVDGTRVRFLPKPFTNADVLAAVTAIRNGA